MTGLVDIVNLDQLLNHAEHQFYWLITGSPSPTRLLLLTHFGPCSNSTLILSGKSRPDHPVAGFFPSAQILGVSAERVAS